MNSKNLFYKVYPQHFDKEIVIPTSKSYANRALILGALRGNNFKVKNISPSTDVENLLIALEEIGLKYTRIENEITFHNKFPDCEVDITSNVITLNSGDGGTTNRFLMAFLAKGSKTYILIPSEKMLERPLNDLIEPLNSLNVFTAIDKTSITIKGPALVTKNSKVDINCEKSTQFASAIKLAFSQTELKINLINLNSSLDYIKMTEWVISESKTKNEFLVPIDFSSMSYPIALAAISGRVLIKNCFETDLLQADSRFLKLIESSGGDISFSKEGLNVSNKKLLSPFMQDSRECPDLVMTLCYLAANINGTSVITNLNVLKAKESNRLEEILSLLKLFEVMHTYDNSADVLKITGNSKLKVALKHVTTARDHRIVMLAYLFLRTHSGGQLENADCVQKSFPNFFELMA